MIAQPETVLDLKDHRNWRTRTSAHVEMGGMHYQIDASPEFRMQCIQNNITWIDYFILTHGHADHILGMDDLRRFCDLRDGSALPVYTNQAGRQRIENIFPYAVCDTPVAKGYAAFKINELEEKWITPGGLVESTTLEHGETPVLGLVFTEKTSEKKLTYFTDCKRVSPEQRDLARGSDVVVLDALKFTSHRNHMTIDEAIETAQDIGAPKTYFVHMTHQVDHQSVQATLPEGIQLAYDGLLVEC